MKRSLVVRPGSPLLQHPATERIHEYPSGDVLIRTGAPSEESARDDERPVRTGLQLHGIRLPEAQVKRHEQGEFGEGEYLAYVVLAGPPAAEWVERLAGAGLELIRYQPHNCYLARGTGRAFARAAALGIVLDIVDLTADLKPAPRIAEAGTARVRVVAQVGPDRVEELWRELASTPGVTLAGDASGRHLDGTVQLDAEVTVEGQGALLAHPRVLAVEELAPRRLEDERANLILAGAYGASGRPQGSYLAWLEEHGVSGRGVAIGIVDGGVDTSHPAFQDRVVDFGQGRKSWHGTFVAGHAAGAYLDERDDQQFIYGLGVAPAAEILVQDNARSPQELCLETVISKGPSGARGVVQNNSWGQGQKSPMDYGSLEAAYDSLVRNADPGGPEPRPLVVCFSAGNAGAGGLTRPKAAKNIIVTGNSESFRPDVGKTESDDIDQVFEGAHPSSHGNCADGRVRPDLVAPGEWTASASYDSQPGRKEYISPRLTWGGGSSAASPKTAGACALLIEWWRRRNEGKDPSPAMVRALLVNGAVDMAAGGPVPNKLQGWGRLHLGNALRASAARVLCDQETHLQQPGDRRTWKVRAADASQPVRVTLAWTDPPGPLNSGTADVPAIVNPLALRVVTAVGEHHGNQLEDGWSVPGPCRDPERRGLDNVQNVFLRPGAAGASFTVEVEALSVTTNCLTNRPLSPQQDFALVVSNASLDGEDAPVPRRGPVEPPKPEPPKPAAGPRAHREPSVDDWWTEPAAKEESGGTRAEEASRVEIAVGPKIAAKRPPISTVAGAARPVSAALAPAPRRTALSAKRLHALAPAERSELLARMSRPIAARSIFPIMRVIEPAPAASVPVIAGDFKLWVDLRGETVLYAPRVPRLSRFSLTVRRESAPDGRIFTSGGTAMLEVTIAPPGDPRDLADLRDAWTAAIVQAGHAARAFQFRPLRFRAVTPSIVLPEGDVVRKQSSASDPPETVHHCVELTERAAAAWHEALERGSAASIQGNCEVGASYAAQEGVALRAGEHLFSAPLGRLLEGCGAGCVTVVNPRVSFSAPVSVDRCEHVESVAVTLVPSEGGAQETFTCGPEGMSERLILRSATPDAMTIRWSAEVHFKYPGWPAERLDGALSVASADWALMLSPGDLVKKITVAASLLDGGGDPIAPLPGGAEPEGGDFAVGLLQVPPSPAAGAPLLPVTFRATCLSVQEVPVPRSSEPVFTVYSFRGGREDVAVCTLGPGESTVLALVDMNGGIRICTEQTPVGETSLESNLLASLHRLSARP
jgi:subtilisin family serine protease